MTRLPTIRTAEDIQAWCRKNRARLLCMAHGEWRVDLLFNPGLSRLIDDGRTAQSAIGKATIAMRKAK